MNATQRSNRVIVTVIGQDRVGIIAYLRSISPNNVPLPAPLPEAAPAEGAAPADGTAATTTEGAPAATTTAAPAPGH